MVVQNPLIRKPGNVGAFSTSAASAQSVSTGITVTSLGTSTTNTLTIGSSVPPGALVCVCVFDNSTTGPAAGEALADSVNAGNYTAGPGAALNGANANGFGEIFYLRNSLPMLGGVATITYTKFGAGATQHLSAFYATGIATTANPGEASATATGSSTTPSVTSGSPTAGGELFVGCVAGGAALNASTQDTAHGWIAPPNTATNLRLFGGSLVGGPGAKIYAPTITNTTWAALIIAFKHP